ncbi:MAG TPA: hypothetical protein VKR06_17495 [Ktedonosporobacter sp.]|nr:hypothetical protein [Ktedonosporobacter sp.]
MKVMRENMKQHPPQPEPLLDLQATANELIAINLAIGYFQRYCKHISPVYPEASQLLDQFQRRHQGQLPEMKH